MAKNETPVEREPLDIDAWIDGAERPEAEVTLTSAGKSLVALAHARRQRDKELRKRQPVPGRMVQDTATGLDAEIAELEAKVKAAEQTFLLRGMDGETHQELLRQNKDGGGSTQEMLNLVVAACLVEPTMTVDQVRRLRRNIGEGQFSILWQAANSLSFDREPDLDF